MLEKPPSRNLRYPNFSEAMSGLAWVDDAAVKRAIRMINEQYAYWDKVKYHPLPKGIKPEDLWAVVKMIRDVSSLPVQFGSHRFKYNLTPFLQKEIHLFDLHTGGTLQSIVPVSEKDKTTYMVSSFMEEAIASSQIEGASSTRKKAKEMLRKNRNPRNRSERMIVNNYKTIRHIVEQKHQPLTPAALLEIHKLITAGTLDNAKHEGTFRKNDEIHVVDNLTGEIMHTPPGYKEIPAFIHELCRFFNEENDSDSSAFIHPLIKGITLHFIVGFFHPFADGNGRTARSLFYWYLLSRGYWLIEYLSISRLILKSKNQYARAYLCTETDENDLTYFIQYNLKTLRQAFDDLRKYIIRKQSDKKQIASIQKKKGLNERQTLILSWLMEDPDLTLTVKETENRLSVSNQTARTDLQRLVNEGLLKPIEINAKEILFASNLHPTEL